MYVYTREKSIVNYIMAAINYAAEKCTEVNKNFIDELSNKNIE